MTRSSFFAIAYTIYYVYVYINVCSRGIRAPTRIAPPPASFPRKLRVVGLTFLRREVWDYTLFQRWINHSSKGKRVKPKEETNGKGRARERERGARCAIATRTLFFLFFFSVFFFLSSRELYNLRYVTSPSKIHFTIHTNIYNRYINNMERQLRRDSAQTSGLTGIFPIE